MRQRSSEQRRTHLKNKQKSDECNTETSVSAEKHKNIGSEAPETSESSRLQF